MHSDAFVLCRTQSGGFRAHQTHCVTPNCNSATVYYLDKHIFVDRDFSLGKKDHEEKNRKKDGKNIICSMSLFKKEL